MKKIFFIILIFLSNKFFAIDNENFAFFIPPENWEVVNPQSYPPLIKISFIKKQISTCRPTLNLAIQKTTLKLEEYSSEAKKTHMKEPNVNCKILDKIQLSQGLGNILKINKTTNGVDFEILQMIFVKDGFAYVLTTACKEEEMLNNYKNFMDVFSSFKIIDNLFSLISDKNKKEELLNEYNHICNLLRASNEKEKKKNLTLFEKYLDKKFANLGKYFQVLLIKQAYKN